MTREEIIITMSDTFAHRISDEPTEDGKWLIWTTNKSVATNEKFVRRAKDAGIRGVFCRAGKVGCLSDN